MLKKWNKDYRLHEHIRSRTFEGSLAIFVATYLALVYLKHYNEYYYQWLNDIDSIYNNLVLFIIALVHVIVEAISPKEMDNIFLVLLGLVVVSLDSVCDLFR